jgi:hypothetical protein
LTGVIISGYMTRIILSTALLASAIFGQAGNVNLAPRMATIKLYLPGAGVETLSFPQNDPDGDTKKWLYWTDPYGCLIYRANGERTQYCGGAYKIVTKDDR